VIQETHYVIRKQFEPAAARYFIILCCRFFARGRKTGNNKDGSYHSAEGSNGFATAQVGYEDDIGHIKIV
jgi:hypothetical protein